jgi:hypothetical protein
MKNKLWILLKFVMIENPLFLPNHHEPFGVFVVTVLLLACLKVLGDICINLKMRNETTKYF